MRSNSFRPRSLQRPQGARSWGTVKMRWKGPANAINSQPTRRPSGRMVTAKKKRINEQGGKSGLLSSWRGFSRAYPRWPALSIHPTSCSQLRPLLTSSVHLQVFRLGRLIGPVSEELNPWPLVRAATINRSASCHSVRSICRQPDTGDPPRQRKLVDRTHTEYPETVAKLNGFR